MYLNYGDVNFFDYGMLVDTEHSDTDIDIIFCMPIYDTDTELYYFGEVTICINDEWIDKKSVMSYIGMDDKSFNNIQYAIGCLEYYGAENFGTDFQNWQYTREEICNILKHRLITCDNINIDW